MNKQRRARIEEVKELLEQAKEIIEEVKDEEEEAFDNFPESIQNSERGEMMECAIYDLEEAYDGIDDVIDSLESAQG